ncbi:MAG: ABC transporter substrate-binding protein [Hoeflea sp.]|nr:CmpA/NrtA family ABC transporter substrate-binding protein [Hoeflea sp.]MBU4531588.1 ABC transporter substrate-binding protein [Alphaproteobacteria bacterium]MBU4544445.1 ABC transporter substrate-binding protein [Alphaproteobacteria bacterium]MBU4550318.1 ABC transporter substrate-binding protein [Alphaproteobacteria bacterium]MBV1724864.1 ABC transporter substrate-binding protein [Hoeflea sp.]MBV1760884.1 ABC transporter substrate-binding protein [Hoeflea sp.]
MTELTAGFLPLTDSAILIAARERGFAEAEGLALNLVRETSWANVRDKLAVGQFEISHALAPMPIAANLGLTPFDTRLIAPMALGLGGNAITVSNRLLGEMQRQQDFELLDARRAGEALAKVVFAGKSERRKPLQFGVVHPFSGHNFELRYWLSASGVTPEADIEIVILPPSLMADALASGQIDGYCVGEPWNTVGVARGAGRIVTTKSSIWASSPEKVLAVREEWADRDPQTLHALLRALYRSAEWCGQPENHSDLAELLSQPTYLGQPASVILPALDGSILGRSGPAATPDFFQPHSRVATFPWQSHALWFYSQMVRWGYVEHTAHHAGIARQTFRPDIYRSVLSAIDVPVPSANSKVEGALSRTIAVGASSRFLYLGPDGFFDGAIFDPDKLDAYIESQKA